MDNLPALALKHHIARILEPRIIHQSLRLAQPSADRPRMQLRHPLPVLPTARLPPHHPHTRRLAVVIRATLPRSPPLPAIRVLATARVLPLCSRSP
ncbi:hypothetical protein DL89DRAFT_270875 [Linderina pennispora]|uniref:Uncharacterized protein n=1 Tax=Linderina pennispora TaxID=61395 RepID=A0A1Y1VW48_9FUNG|nr:uncharacterized protein DL89DRAFT_270875 [Linderina pennispora]ORX65512.1 hypothetical protein DL89DRAFT_270875 [Linderina pennispora]